MGRKNSKRNSDICELLTLGFSAREVAESYSLSTAAIYGIYHRQKGHSPSSNDHSGLMSYDEISKKLNMTQSEVMTIIADVLEYLRRRFQNKGLQYSDLAF